MKSFASFSALILWRGSTVNIFVESPKARKFELRACLGWPHFCPKFITFHPSSWRLWVWVPPPCLSSPKVVSVGGGDIQKRAELRSCGACGVTFKRVRSCRPHTQKLNTKNMRSADIRMHNYICQPISKTHTIQHCFYFRHTLLVICTLQSFGNRPLCCLNMRSDLVPITLHLEDQTPC